MISIYDRAGEVYPLAGYEDFCITHKLDGCDTMSFILNMKNEQYPLLQEEGHVDTDDNRWLIKKIDDDKIDCELDFDFLKGRLYFAYKSETKLLSEVLARHLPSDWTVLGASQSAIRRSIEFDACTDFDVIYECIDTYKVRFMWNMKKKTLTVVVPENVASSGEYLTTELNLRSLSFKGDTTEFATRLYCVGKDGMTIEEAQVDDGAGGTKRYGLPYVEDRSYADKVICAYWEDDRYTDPTSMYNDGMEKLKVLANPVRSYECEVLNLAKMAPEEYSFLAFQIHRKLTLVDTDRGVKVEHQIVEHQEYPEESDRDKVTLSCVPDTIQAKLKDAIKSAVSGYSTVVDQKVEAAQALLDSKIMMATAMLTGAFGNYPYSQNGELFMMDNPDPQAAQVVWRWNINGFGKSSTGIDGPYTTALTFNDEFITGVITAMVINAAIVKTGVLQSTDGETFYLDLDKGVLRMKATSMEITGQGTVDEIADKAAEKAASDALKEFAEGDFADTVKELQGQLDQKAESWYQDEDPSSGWTTPEQKAEHKGDMWRVPGQATAKQWNGTGWVDMTVNPPQAVFDEIDGKAQIWATQPKPPYHVNDLWFGGTSSEIKICTTTRESGSFVAGDWIKYDKYIDQQAAEKAASDAADALNNILTQAEIVRRMTNNWAAKGIYMQGNELYINASYLRTGVLDIALLLLSTALGGITSGEGETKYTQNGVWYSQTTHGIMVYGPNGVITDGYGNITGVRDPVPPPFLLITEAGARLQATQAYVYAAGGICGLGGRIVVSEDNFGTALPSSAQNGMVFFLLDS